MKVRRWELVGIFVLPVCFAACSAGDGAPGTGGSRASGGSGGVVGTGSMTGQGGAPGAATGGAGAALVAGASGTAGASGAPGSGGGGGGGGPEGRGGADVGGAAGRPACMLMDDPRAPFVAFERTPAPAPAATGGPIAGGVYFLTRLVYHGGMQVPTPCFDSLLREILRFSPESETRGTLHESSIAGYEDGSVSSRHPKEVKYETSATTMTSTWICGSTGTGPEKQTYSATSTQVRYLRGPFDALCDVGVTLELIYDKQP